jgi:hypothetical protein
MTLHLLELHLQTFLSIPITQKCQILSCDALVANEQHRNEWKRKLWDLTFRSPLQFYYTRNNFDKTLYEY